MTESTRVDCLAEAVRVGVDLAKRIVQVHAVNAAGRDLCSRNLPRDKLDLHGECLVNSWKDPLDLLG